MSDAAVKLQLGQELTRGLGSGSDSEIGKRAAEARTTASAPGAARLGPRVRDRRRGRRHRHRRGAGRRAHRARARRADRRHRHHAVPLRGLAPPADRRCGLERLQAEVDTLIAVPNDRLLEVLDRNVSMVDAFRVADDVLRQGVQGICDLITRPGLINLDFADVRAVMQQSGNALMGIGMATGPTARRCGDARHRLAADRPPDPRARPGILLRRRRLRPEPARDHRGRGRRPGGGDENANIIFGASVDDAGDRSGSPSSPPASPRRRKRQRHRAPGGRQRPPRRPDGPPRSPADDFTLEPPSFLS